MAAMLVRCRRPGPPLLFAALLATGCGDITTISPDATPADAEPDLPEVGTVTLDLHSPFDGAEGPVAGADVLVLRPDGTVIAETTTDDEGIATVDEVPAGSIMLIALEIVAGAPGSVTIAVYDLQPGDDIRFRGEAANGDFLGSMDVNLPTHPDTPASYVVASGCGSSTDSDTSVPVSFSAACVIDDDADVLAWARDADQGVLGFLSAQRPFVSPGTMDLTGLTWSAPQTIALEVHAIPSQAGAIAVRAEQVLDLRTYGNIVETPFQSTDSADLSFDIPRPASFGDSTLVELSLRANQSGLGEQQVSTRVAPEDDELDVLLEDGLLPWYGGTAYSIEDRVVTWSRTSGDDPDGHYLLLVWEEESDGSTGGWFAISPPDWTELRLPPLPDGWEERQPREPASVEAALFAAESSEVDGWDGARQRGFDLVFDDTIIRAAPGTVMRRSVSAGGDL